MACVRVAVVSRSARRLRCSVPPEHRLSCSQDSSLFVEVRLQREQGCAEVNAVALVAATIVPEIAEAATPGVSPSLKNLLLSVVAGRVVAAALEIAVARILHV